MAKKVDFFAEDPGRYERFKLEFTAQGVIDDVIDVLLERHGDALKVRDGEESDLSRLVAGCCFAKAHKTFTPHSGSARWGSGRMRPYC